MSRTYHHGDRAKRRLYPSFHFGGTPPADLTPPKRKRGSMPWFWMRGTPSAWNNLMHTRPWRRRTNAAILRALARPWEDVVMPHWKRPHVYFW